MAGFAGYGCLHSAQAWAKVNEHIEIAKKKEIARGSAQGVLAR